MVSLVSFLVHQGVFPSLLSEYDFIYSESVFYS